MSVSDNGGAIAIKGFNFQKASAILVMLHNLNNEDLLLIPESKEDFEVRTGNLVYYVQVKSIKSLSMSKMLLQNKTKQKSPIPGSSIIEKNLVPGHDEDYRKIIVSTLISDTQSKLKAKISGLSVNPNYTWSEEQINEISTKLSLNKKQIQRLSNQEIFKTPFPDVMSTAIVMLKGKMVELGLSITDESATAALGILALEIDTKSEIINDEQAKQITGIYLQKLFESVKHNKLFDEILNDLGFNIVKKNRVKKEKVKITQMYVSLKCEIEEKIDISCFTDDMENKDIIDHLLPIVSSCSPSLNNDLCIALSIDCLCNLMEKN